MNDQFLLFPLEDKPRKPKVEIQLFDYQQLTVGHFEDWYFNGVEQEALIALTIGMGKTVTAAACIKALLDKKPDFRILWLTHRDELLKQASDEIEDYTGFTPEIEKAERVASGDARIIVASVQSLRGKRLIRLCQSFTPNLIIFDEAHHSLASSWMQIKQAFGTAKILNLTATPYRTDISNRLDLGRVLMEKNTSEGIRMGRLVPPKPVGKVEIDLGTVKLKLGDYASDSLSDILCKPELIQACTEVIQQNARGQKSILFAATVAHGNLIAQALRAQGFRVAEVYGETPIPERQNHYKAIINGQMDILINNLCLTEGFNLPCLTCVIMLRPTKNAALYLQCIGRGLRKDPNNTGKKDCLIIDILDTAKRKTGDNVLVLPNEDDQRRFAAMQGKPATRARVFLDWFFRANDIEQVVAGDLPFEQCVKIASAQQLYDLLTPTWYKQVRPTHQQLVSVLETVWKPTAEEAYNSLLPGFRCNNAEVFVKLMAQHGWVYLPHGKLPQDEEEMEVVLAGVGSEKQANYTLNTLISQDSDLQHFLLDILDSESSLQEQAAKCYDIFEDSGRLLAWFKPIKDYGIRFHFIQYKTETGDGIILVRSEQGKIYRFKIIQYKPVWDETYRFSVDDVPNFVKGTRWAEQAMSENQAPAVAKILEIPIEELQRVKISKLAASSLMSNHWNHKHLKQIAAWLQQGPPETEPAAAAAPLVEEDNLVFK